MSSQASFRTRCPHCSKVLSVRAELGGKTVACPNPACGKSVTLPAAAETPSVQAAPTKVVDPAAQPRDIADQLQKLHQLHESGALSDEEFATAKKTLLNGPAKAKQPYLLTGAKPAETKPADALWHLVPDQLQKLLQPLTEYWAGLQRAGNPIQKLLQALAEYWAGLQRAGNPKLFGDYIASKEGNAANIYKFIGASIVLTLAVEFVLPSKSLIEFTPSGEVNTLLTMLIWFLGALLTASVAYTQLRLLGGQGGFFSTVIAALYVTALYYPMFSLLEGLFKLFTNQPMPKLNYLTLVPFCQIVAQIHNLSMRRTIVAVLGANVPLAVLLLSLMITAKNHLGDNATAISPPGERRDSQVFLEKHLGDDAPALSPDAVQRQTIQREHADCRQVKLRELRPKSPAELAAIRAADIDRGQSVLASTDPAEIAEIVGFVAPGFTAKLPVIPGGVAIVEEHFGRTCILSTHPLDPVRPCILTSTIDVPKGKQTLLTFDVSHSAAGDWQVIVLANGESLYDAPVGPKTAHNGWLAVSVDLTRFAGQRVVLELQNKATGYSHEWGWWDNIKITDPEVEESNEPFPADTVTPPQTAAVQRPTSPRYGARPQPLDCTGPNGVSADVVRRAQEAWAKYLGRDVEAEVEIANGVTMTFVLVPPGTFQMGSPPYEMGKGGRYPNETLHVVTLTEPFDLGKYEVTQAQYKALTGNDPSWFKGSDRPVEQVTWNEADAFGRELTKKLSDGHVYRLATEAEWEYSCRGGRPSSQAYGVGDGHTLTVRDANFNNQIRQTSNVGSYPPNALGLCDMHGNVWEWCADWNEPYPDPNQVVIDPLRDTRSPGNPFRVARGGCHNEPAAECRAALRQGSGEDRRDCWMGFRIARSIPTTQPTPPPGESTKTPTASPGVSQEYHVHAIIGGYPLNAPQCGDITGFFEYDSKTNLFGVFSLIVKTGSEPGSSTTQLDKTNSTIFYGVAPPGVYRAHPQQVSLNIHNRTDNRDISLIIDKGMWPPRSSPVRIYVGQDPGSKFYDKGLTHLVLSGEITQE